MGENFVVTITRQFGSMGRPIAIKMAELLGIEYYDRDIVEMAARELDLPISVISNSEETAKSSFFRMSLPLGGGTSEIQNRIFAAQSKIISELAERESCVLVGRCTDYLLRNHKNSIHIYIYAPYEDRISNCINYLMMEPDEAKRMIANVDKARDSYHKCYAGYLPEDCHYKDILINSSLLGIEETALYLTKAVKQRFQLSGRDV